MPTSEEEWPVLGRTADIALTMLKKKAIPTPFILKQRDRRRTAWVRILEGLFDDDA
jgi:hypothetical protein